MTTAQKKHYDSNKEQYAERNKRTREDKRQWLREQKDRPCTDCGVKYPHYVMDFDHLPENDKEFNIARSISANPGWERLKEEVEKCEVVCANCHRIRTHKRYMPSP